MGKQKMTKLSNILLFTFIICVHFTINTLENKNLRHIEESNNADTDFLEEENKEESNVEAAEEEEEENTEEAADEEEGMTRWDMNDEMARRLGIRESDDDSAALHQAIKTYQNVANARGMGDI